MSMYSRCSSERNGCSHPSAHIWMCDGQSLHGRLYLVPCKLRLGVLPTQAVLPMALKLKCQLFTDLSSP